MNLLFSFFVQLPESQTTCIDVQLSVVEQHYSVSLLLKSLLFNKRKNYFQMERRCKLEQNELGTHYKATFLFHFQGNRIEGENNVIIGFFNGLVYKQEIRKISKAT